MCNDFIAFGSWLVSVRRICLRRQSPVRFSWHSSTCWWIIVGSPNEREIALARSANLVAVLFSTFRLHLWRGPTCNQPSPDIWWETQTLIIWTFLFEFGAKADRSNYPN